MYSSAGINKKGLSNIHAFSLLFYFFFSSLLLSQPLPLVSCLHSPLPNELFGDAAMIMEFIHHYGPAFNIKDAISSQITYGMHILMYKHIFYSHPTCFIFSNVVLVRYI